MSPEFQKEVLQHLRKNGSDISKPHDFEFYLSLPTRESAERTAVKIRQSGFAAAEVSRSVSGSAWLCVAQQSLTPEKANLADHARFFEQVAAAVGGVFDGWEAETV